MPDIASLLAMIARRAPILMRCGSVVAQPRQFQFQRPDITSGQVAEMERRLRDGQSIQEIADAMGLLRDSVARHTRHAREVVRRSRRAA